EEVAAWVRNDLHTTGILGVGLRPLSNDPHVMVDPLGGNLILSAPSAPPAPFFAGVEVTGDGTRIPQATNTPTAPVLTVANELGSSMLPAPAKGPNPLVLVLVAVVVLAVVVR
ncbi:MAG TPA: hypothetical protein VHI93_02305, partial [Candidatus Thermoplasmatota archaeon]|nr:hypothetical protein [Candidatus Thermoplasmatota archaeon]